MPQFDVHRLANRPGLVVDCQSDLFEHLDTRFVIPLSPRDRAPPPASRLNPVFVIDGGDQVLLTQGALTVHRRELGSFVATLANRRLDIIGAIDILITGV